MKHKRYFQNWKLILGALFCVNLSAGQTPQPPIYAFDDEANQCIVNKSDLKRPWFNRLGNDVFFTWVTHNGYIESFLLDPANNGLVNPQTVSGHFYVKDNMSNDFFLINESDGEDNWRGVIGLGYSQLSKTKLNLETRLNYFIPRKDNVLVILIEISNKSNQARQLSAIGQVEWNLGDPTKKIAYPTDGVGGSQHNLYKRVSVEDDIMYASQNNWRGLGDCIPWPYIGFFASNERVASFETMMENFVGTAGTWKSPEGLKSKQLRNTNFMNYDEYPLGVLKTDISLGPGESRKMVFMLGMEKDKEDIFQVKNKYSDLAQVETEFQATKKYYEDFLAGTINIQTPDKENDRIINIWSQYHWRQWFKKELDTRSAGSGFWTYGLEGGSLTLHPESPLLGLDMDLIKGAVSQIILSNQNPDTSIAVLSVSPPAMLDIDVEREWPPREITARFEVPHHHQIYVPLFSTYFYLLESGNLEFLDERLPYIDGTSGTVFEHIEKALAIAVMGITDRGMPKIPKGSGDWMDEFTKISKNGNAESVMLGAQIAYLLRGFAEIAQKTGREEQRAKWMAIYEKIRKGINEYGWDGNWYIRAFSDTKTGFQSVGSKENDEGKIYLNSQSWPILSGISTAERADLSMESVQKYLSSEYGALVFWPSYTKYVDYIGTQSIYAPGFRNGNIYFRPAGWAIIAAAMTGKIELANEIYHNTSLSVRSQDMDRYLLEPFVYPENYIGPDHARKGEGQFHWCFGEGTGWMWYAYVGYILGVRAELDGLRIDPKIPQDWEGFKVKKPFRGAIYQIEVVNPQGVTSGVKSIKVDGKKIRGTLVPSSNDGKVHKVQVLMGT